MTRFEQLCLLAGFPSVDVLVGLGYAKVVYLGLEFFVWLVDPAEIMGMEQGEQEEEPC